MRWTLGSNARFERDGAVRVDVAPGEIDRAGAASATVRSRPVAAGGRQRAIVGVLVGAVTGLLTLATRRPQPSSTDTALLDEG